MYLLLLDAGHELWKREGGHVAGVCNCWHVGDVDDDEDCADCGGGDDSRGDDSNW